MPWVVSPAGSIKESDTLHPTLKGEANACADLARGSCHTPSQLLTPAPTTGQQPSKPYRAPQDRHQLGTAPTQPPF